MVVVTTANGQFDQDERIELAQHAIEAAASAAAAHNNGQVPADLAAGGWRWNVFNDLKSLSSSVYKDYDNAQTKQRRQAWESRFGGPVVTGAGAAVGSIVSAVGAGLIKTNTVAGWVIVALGIIIAIGGSVTSANNYVQNRSKKLRFLRLLFDIWDYAYLVLPTATAADTYTQLDNFRQLWETAGSS